MQFSLRGLLAAVVAAGAGAALWTAQSSWQLGAVEALLLVFAPAAAITLAVHSTATARAWWIGIATAAAFAAILLFLQSTLLLAYDSSLSQSPFPALMRFAEALSFSFRAAILAWALAPVVGILCMVTHWLLIGPPQGPRG